MHFQYSLKGFWTMGLWACLFAPVLGVMLTGCTVTGLYGQRDRHLNLATQAFFARDWPRAKKRFFALAAQTQNPKAVNAGIYGLACVDMAAAEDVPSFLEALKTLSRESGDRFRSQDPELLILAADHGFRLMEKKQKDQADQLLRLGLEKKSSVETIKTLEQAIKRLKHQIQVLERIDQELQEKRNPS
ncbi:hypothetical protein [Desulfospira joergensenii]|uniref:hypothetical protein n=1 Tax=Desulfospira joergensenii TaxID=53329 RepID=UPI0003B5AED3|nr:hypothetical protein [Desulfospira joergensenii]